MALFARKTESLAHANHILRGGILGGLDMRKLGEGVFGLDGLTLVFNSAAETVTFSAASAQTPLSGREILDQIETALTARLVQQVNGRLGFIDADFSLPIILDAASTAAALLGFDGGVITGKLYTPPGGAQPSLVSLTPGFTNDSTYLLVTDE